MQVHCIAVLRLSSVSVAQHGCCANTLKGTLVPGTTESQRRLNWPDKGCSYTGRVPNAVSSSTVCKSCKLGILY